ncbi:hypothetical protein QWA68_015577 [Fusarium oxysporum]|nr:hypothetical protein QWA68_015577 [Fusarium oxysporum]
MAFTCLLLINFYSVGAHAPKIGQASNGPISPEDDEPYAEFFDPGGMSNVFRSASSQDKAITCYIKPWNGKRKGFYDVRGDAQPDFSLLGDDYMMLTGGNPLTRDGTSASAPVFAAMIALVNGMRLRAEKPALGFLSPLLYSSKASPVFRDVKDDSETEGCADGNFIEPGWDALGGWDATGLGEPDFTR